MARALAGFDMSDDATLDFEVIGYRGGIVATVAGWQRDVKKRGGIVTNIPGGFFHDIRAARFGATSPYVYELPPMWLLVFDGIDVGTAEFLEWANYQGIAEEADNQMQGLRDVVDGAGDVVKNLSTGRAVMWAALGIGGILGIQALRTFAPASPPRRRR